MRNNTRKGRSIQKKTSNESTGRKSTQCVADTSKQEGYRNDFSWYDRNPLLTQAVGRIPFPLKPGMELPELIERSDSASGSALWNGNASVPGIFQIDWMPSIGQSAYATDPASVAAREVFAKVRSVFSGSIDADAPDFVIYLLALDSVFAYIASLKRIYRTLNAYTPMNYMFPDGLLVAMGLSQSATIAWHNDRINLWRGINELVAMSRKFICPAVFDVFNRHYWLNDNVYLDADTPNSQAYVFHQTHFYKFAMLNTPADVSAGGLTLEKPNLSSVEDAIDFGRTLINTLAGSDDAYIISGYLTRAYDSAQFYVAELAQDELLTPFYSEPVLAQIENATGVIIDAIDLTSCNITQDPATNALLSSPRLTSTSTRSSITPMLSIRSDTPSVEQVVEATRLATYIAPDDTIVCGTELVTNFYFVMTSDAGTPQPIAAETVYALNGSQSTYATMVSAGAWSVSLYSTFDWAPRAFIRISPTSTPGNDIVLMFWDVHNVTTLTDDMMRQLNRVCLFSEFNSFGLL